MDVFFQFDQRVQGDHVPYLLVPTSCNKDDDTLKGTVLVSTHLFGTYTSIYTRAVN